MQDALKARELANAILGCGNSKESAEGYISIKIYRHEIITVHQFMYHFKDFIVQS